jgi:parallel beta-helix repeat protein
VIVMGTLSEANADTPRRNSALFTIADTGEAGITITGKAGTNAKLARTAAASARILYLETGTSVTVKNISITGGQSSFGAGIYADHAELTLDTGAEITGNTIGATSYGGAGLFAEGSTLIMRGSSKVHGNSSNHNGGGIYLQVSQLIMDGSEISGNTSKDTGGGIYLNDECTVILKNGARITGNTSINGAGGGIAVLNGSILTLEDAVITENWANTGGGLALSGKARLEMKDGTISDNHTHTTESGAVGGGVTLWGGSVFTMSGGTISDNTARTSGGGVYIDESSFTISGNTAIADNAASHGGGVFLYLSSFTMKDNSSISGNTAVNAGGGVYIKQSSSTFIKKGGTIYGDTDTTQADTENTAATGKGHAVYVASSPVKYRNDDAGPAVNLYAANSDGSWTFNDTSEDGAGDTTENWESPSQ